jgi:hypothetical protein
MVLHLGLMKEAAGLTMSKDIKEANKMMDRASDASGSKQIIIKQDTIIPFHLPVIMIHTLTVTHQLIL